MGAVKRSSPAVQPRRPTLLQNENETRMTQFFDSAKYVINDRTSFFKFVQNYKALFQDFDVDFHNIVLVDR